MALSFWYDKFKLVTFVIFKVVVPESLALYATIDTTITTTTYDVFFLY